MIQLALVVFFSCLLGTFLGRSAAEYVTLLWRERRAARFQEQLETRIKDMVQGHREADAYGATRN